MIGVIVVSETKTSVEIVKALRHILGRKHVKGFASCVLKYGMGVSDMQNLLKESLEGLGDVSSVVVLSEMFGSTQTQACLKFAKGKGYPVVCGYNLAMLMEACLVNTSSSLPVFLKKLQNIGKKSVMVCDNE